MKMSSFFDDDLRAKKTRARQRKKEPENLGGHN